MRLNSKRPDLKIEENNDIYEELDKNIDDKNEEEEEQPIQNV